MRMDDKSIRELLALVRNAEPILKQHKGPARRHAKRQGSASTAPAQPKRFLVNQACAKGYGGRETIGYSNRPAIVLAKDVKL